MKRLLFSLFVLTCSASPSWAAGLTLSIHDGLVSIDAQDVTVRQILTEWARIGKTRIINVERIAGGPITVKLDKVPEKQALDIILRSIPGYMALPRDTQVADASNYERILIMATTTTVAALRPQQQTPGFAGQGGSVTQLRPNIPAPMIPGMVLDAQDPADQMDDPAIAAAAAAGLVPVPGFNPGASPFSAPLMPPLGAPQAQPQPAPAAPGVGAPTNPWGVAVGTAQPSLAPPEPVATPNPNIRVRPPQPDR
jgi:hypothetical protein